LTKHPKNNVRAADRGLEKLGGDSRMASYRAVLSGVVEQFEGARRAAARSVNHLMTAVYWEIGRRIVESEQSGRGGPPTARPF